MCIGEQMWAATLYIISIHFLTKIMCDYDLHGCIWRKWTCFIYMYKYCCARLPLSFQISVFMKIFLLMAATTGRWGIKQLAASDFFGSIFLLFFSFNEISQGSTPAPRKADSPGWVSILQCFDDLIGVWLHAQTWKSSPKMFSPSFKLVKVLLMHKAWIMSPKNSEPET